MVVVIQTVVEGRAVFNQSGNASAIGEENIEIAVIIEIEYGDSAESDLDERFVFSSAVIENEVNAGSWLPVLKGDWPRGPLCSGGSFVDGWRLSARQDAQRQDQNNPCGSDQSPQELKLASLYRSATR